MSFESTYKVADLIASGKLWIGDGYRAKNSELGSSGIPFARAGDINDGFHFKSGDHLPESDSWKAGNKLSEVGDVVFTSKGTVGRFGYVTESIRRFVYSPQLCFWRSLDNGVIHPRFLFYWVQGKEFYAQYKSVSQKTDMAEYVSLADQRAMEITLPNLDQQKAIAHILGTLDDKIELNRQTSETLEAMAKALFKSWFVDFDPVRAKAEGRSTGLPAEISDLFPDSCEDSELGEIPRGWRVWSLDRIGINPRQTVRPEEMDSADRYIGLEHMPRGSICLGDSGQVEDLESNKNRFRHGDILFGKLRPYFKKAGYAQFNGVCSTDIVVVRKKAEYGTGFICCLLASDPFIDFTVAASSGTRMPRTSWKDMCEFPFAIPSSSLLREFDSQFLLLINKIASNCIQSASLAELRDTLLPKLISGELRIPEAEKLLESVL